MDKRETPRRDRAVAFSIDFEGYTEAMQESFRIPSGYPRFDIEAELQANTDRCLSLFGERHVRATFFVLGWIAERFPSIVRAIANAGHEIGSHSYFHQRLTDASPARLDEVRRSREILEDVSGSRVSGFRAPDFCVPDDERFFDHLAAAGFQYDASLNPTTFHDVYARAHGVREIHRLPSGLVEFPPATVSFGTRFVLTVGGGGYFRLFPWVATRWALRRSPAAMTYLHPYEIGGHFPRDLPMSLTRRFRHGFRNGRIESRLRKLFSDFEPMPVRDYLERAGFKV